MEYYKVEIDGFVAYCDAFIIDKAGVNPILCQFLSLIGTPSTVKAISALLYSNRSCFLSNGKKEFQIRFDRGIQTLRTRKIDDSVVKIFVGTNSKTGEGLQESFVFGQDEETLKHRAFLILDAATSIPLKPEWENWLYEEILDSLPLYSFGSKELTHSCLIRWPDNDSFIQEKVLEGIDAGYLK